MARKSVYEAMNYFDTRYNMCADWDMGFRIAESYDVAYVPEPLIDLRSKQIMPHQFSTPDVAATSMGSGRTGTQKGGITAISH